MSSRGPPALSSYWVFLWCSIFPCLHAICIVTPPSLSPHLPCDVTFYSPFFCALSPPVAYVRTSSGRCGWGRRWREVSLVIVCWCRWGSRRGGGRSRVGTSSLLPRPDSGAAATTSLFTSCLRLFVLSKAPADAYRSLAARAPLPTGVLWWGLTACFIALRWSGVKNPRDLDAMLVFTCKKTRWYH